jgi:2-dehydro-3-deoxy-D-arabinonate dehydratase
MTTLERRATDAGPRWLLDGQRLPASFTLSNLLQRRAGEIPAWLAGYARELATTDAEQPALPPIEPMHEVWACGVTYLRSRDARKAESSVADIYERVYQAERPELFLKAIGWRVVTAGQAVRIRADSAWNVPEPELTLVINAHGEIVGYTAGNDMSSRDIEGENPLYLPQAKIYNGACALGPQIVLTSADAMRTLPITLTIMREGALAFSGATSVDRMKRRLEELVDYLFRELDFPYGVFLMTGTGIVPPEDFSLRGGDQITITVGAVTLENIVATTR